MLPSFFQAIGTDRYMSEAELVAVTGDHPDIATAWPMYQSAFEGFCETGLDPQCHRLRHPTRAIGSLTIDPDDPVLVVGTGPSTTQALPALARMKDRMWLFTSPRGAELLAGHGLVPDLVLIEHRTALDAHHSTRHVLDGQSSALGAVPLVAADWRTPPELLNGVAGNRLFVPDPLPTWGLWPATAVALAITAGARRIGVLGIDLGTTDRPDPAFTPLASLLGLIARVNDVTAVDCGPVGARKPGWSVGTLDSLAPDGLLGVLGVDRRRAPSTEERYALAQLALRRLSRVVSRARHILAMSLKVRGGDRTVRGLEAAATDLLSWSNDREVRLDLQESLGLSFLPRMWRTGIDLTLGPELWRPLVLATHELVGQAARLDAVVRKAAA